MNNVNRADPLTPFFRGEIGSLTGSWSTRWLITQKELDCFLQDDIFAIVDVTGRSFDGNDLVRIVELTAGLEGSQRCTRNGNAGNTRL